jgi:hypothetical protein
VPCLVLTKVEVSLQVPYRFVLGAEGRGRLIGECRTQGPDDVRLFGTVEVAEEGLSVEGERRWGMQCNMTLDVLGGGDA